MTDFFQLGDITNHDTRLYHSAAAIGYAKVCQPEAWVFASPTASSARLTQYTFGEPLRIFQCQGNWLHAQSLRDGYCGWLWRSQTEECRNAPKSVSHCTRFSAPVTQSADLKSRPIAMLPPDALFTPNQTQGDYLHIPQLGWIHQQHAMLIEKRIDPVTTAHELLGKSYVWGGRASIGLDCSALTQLCYRRANWLIPRDADLQAHYLNAYHQRVTLDAVQAADLIFAPGHVMIATDAVTVIHASGHHMLVVKEPLHSAITRLEETLKPTQSIQAYRYMNE